jgi:hypothetical protein
MRSGTERASQIRRSHLAADRTTNFLTGRLRARPDLLAQVFSPAVQGTWSVRDILAHVTTWEEEALKHLPLIAKGGRPPKYVTYGGIDAFNAQMTEQKRGLSASDVLRQLDETHRRLIDYVQSAPEEQFTRRHASVVAYGSIPTAIIRSTPRRYGHGGGGQLGQGSSEPMRSAMNF